VQRAHCYTHIRGGPASLAVAGEESPVERIFELCTDEGWAGADCTTTMTEAQLEPLIEHLDLPSECAAAAVFALGSSGPYDESALAPLWPTLVYFKLSGDCSNRTAAAAEAALFNVSAPEPIVVTAVVNGSSVVALSRATLRTLYAHLGLDASKDAAITAHEDHAHEESAHGEEACYGVATLLAALGAADDEAARVPVDAVSGSDLAAHLVLNLLHFESVRARAPCRCGGRGVAAATNRPVFACIFFDQQCGAKTPEDPQQFAEALLVAIGLPANASLVPLANFEVLFADLALLPVVADPHAGHDHRRRTLQRRALTPGTCPTPEDLLAAFGFNAPLLLSEFEQLCVALVQLVQSGVCATAAPAAAEAAPSTSDRWGYGVLATAIICILSTLGLLALPLLVETPAGAPRMTLRAFWRGAMGSQDLGSGCRPQRLRLRQTLLSFLLGLAVSTLVGDVILHILPAIWGLHSHDATTGAMDYAYLWRGVLVLGAFYVFYSLQLLLGRLSGHHHLHQGDTHPDVLLDVMDVAGAGHTGHAHGHAAEKPAGPSDHHTEAPGAAPRTVVWLVTIGDAIHNFVDGLALGAAFSRSLAVGLTTTIAIGCHELPHELGDFAVLLDGGWSVRKALAMNFASSLTAFAGLFIGLGAHSAESSDWILCVAAAVFVYVALANILPEMIEHILLAGPARRAWLVYANQLAGFATGTGIMILIARYEDDLRH
jgi:zinc transporter ZupT